MKQSGTIGIVGGGQLGRMLTEAATKLGFKVIVLNPAPNSPAAQVGAQEIVGDLYDSDAIKKLADQSDFVTVEIEHLDADTLQAIGTKVNPAPETVRLIQDKYEQKVYLQGVGIPTASFVALSNKPAAAEALEKFGGKMLIKSRHGAYDGRGNMVVRSQKDIDNAFASFSNELYVEKFVSFQKELAVMVVRDLKDNIATYPVTETVHERNICIETFTPADIGSEVAEQAREVALAVAKHLKGAGVFGVEMFLTEHDQILVNEIAPRVHNSGHYTIEACQTSQFENHIRAITGMELGSTELKVPAAVMINILGERDGPTEPRGIDKAQALPHTYVHLYGKSPTKVDRKMGHITVTADSVSDAKEIAEKARKEISL